MQHDFVSTISKKDHYIHGGGGGSALGSYEEQKLLAKKLCENNIVYCIFD